MEQDEENVNECVSRSRPNGAVVHSTIHWKVVYNISRYGTILCFFTSAVICDEQ